MKRDASEILDQKPPHDDHAEAIVLATLLIHPKILDTADVRPAHFHDNTKRTIFGHLALLRDKRVPVDMQALLRSMSETGDYDRLGGKKAFTDLTTPMPSMFDEYLAVLHDKANRRETLQLCLDTIQGVHGKRPTHELLDDIGGKLRGLAAPTSDAPRLMTRKMSEVTSRKMDHYWQNRFPLGKFSMLSGDPGDGKTLLAIDLTARTTRGSEAPDGSPLPKGRVLFVSCEDDADDTLKPRLEAAGADPDMVDFLDGVTYFDHKAEQWRERQFNLQSDLPVLETYLEQGGFVAVFLDTAAGFTGKIDNNSNTDVRGVLGPLVKLAAKHHVAVIGLAHLTKDNAKAARYRTNGSIGWTGMARSVLALGIDPNDNELRLVAPIKCNLGPKPSTLGFRIRSTPDGVPYLEWLAEPVDVSADEMMGSTSSKGKPLDEVALWLQGELQAGPRLAREVYAAGESVGHSDKQLRRAKDDLGCEVRKDGNRWLWALPQHAHLPPKRASWAPSSKTGVSEGHLDSEQGNLPFVAGQVGRFTIDTGPTDHQGEGSPQNDQGAQIEREDIPLSMQYFPEGAQGDRSSVSAWDSGIDPEAAGL